MLGWFGGGDGGGQQGDQKPQRKSPRRRALPSAGSDGGVQGPNDDAIWQQTEVDEASTPSNSDGSSSSYRSRSVVTAAGRATHLVAMQGTGLVAAALSESASAASSHGKGSKQMLRVFHAATGVTLARCAC